MSDLVELLNDLNQGNRIEYDDYSQLMFCVEKLENENAEQKAQIEKMKCCGNCKYCFLWEDFYTNIGCSLPNTDIGLGNKCDKWESVDE